ncbi:hypothetical protein TSH100_22675 [Azospirillum sp. TSH100]|uniref:hypothetical protein n=1 Tax=Azospirillum sp. TSH100 TaxID=652764 RepID=UPI000D60874D|nr:hypothetical protein [Azospirillum sp. TSH100]PWC82778.1 hypothetical protein TSH100_22675 [Azospirillum sp. TSH100]QCG86635.1 hypothetical protein E6C72_02155 [Azospirillum sp. TSH100]
MPRITNADDLPDTGDRNDRLAELADRTSLMAIDTTLRALGSPVGAISAAGVADIARRMMQATNDFRAAMQDAAE